MNQENDKYSNIPSVLDAVSRIKQAMLNRRDELSDLYYHTHEVYLMLENTRSAIDEFLDDESNHSQEVFALLSDTEDSLGDSEGLLGEIQELKDQIPFEISTISEFETLMNNVEKIKQVYIESEVPKWKL